MGYRFSEEKFIKNFNAKDTQLRAADSRRLTHKHDDQFKLFPYKTTKKTKDPVITELEDVVSGFFRDTLNKKIEPIEFEGLCTELLEEIEIKEADLNYFRDLLQNMFFTGDSFFADNIGLYPYQTVLHKSAENLAHFLFSIFGMDQSDCENIEREKNRYKFNVLEEMVIKTIEAKKVSKADRQMPYFAVKRDIQNRFKSDFYFMLEMGMTSLEDFSNLFSVYYFFYTSQTCIILDHFCTGRRDGEVPFYYALDWERVSKNRLCCEEGWEKLKGSKGLCNPIGETAI